MSRGAAIAAALVFAACGGGLYHLKHRVAVLEDEAERLARALAAERQAIHVLASEWAYLNDPARLAGIAERHLDVAPLDARSAIRLDALPRGAAGAADAAAEDAP